MTKDDGEYTDEDRERDLAAVRRLSVRIARLQRQVDDLSAERLEAIRRLRTLGGAKYQELVKAIGGSRSALQRLLEKLDRDTEGQDR